MSAALTGTLKAQSAPEPKLDALSKANPGNPLRVTAYECLDLGDGTMLLSFTVTGQGYFRCVEVCTGNQLTVVCDWSRSGGQSVSYAYVIQSSNWRGCFFDIVNNHDLPPVY